MVPPLFLLHNAVAHCVFYKGLKCQGRQQKVHGGDLIRDLEPAAETHLFQLEIMFCMGKFLLEGDEFRISQ